MTELMGLLHQPSLRRCWLLHEAVRCAPLDRAIELARAAEAFVAGTDGAGGRRETQPTSEAVNGHDRVEAPASALPESVPNKEPVSPTRTGLALSSEQRDQLLDRIAAGATNAQSAQEFGVSPRQVQGVRMGAAREIANRRDRRAERNVVASNPEIATASAEDIVRYLRQQDEVVVPQDGEFLVNGRFRLSLGELVAKANRMRSRQGKPEFKLANGHASPVSRSGPTNDHPIFWKDPGPAPGPNSGSSI